ncbi:MAG: VapC toxin family PIN domain ribonuclease [Chloroflexi bacterium]|nr:VapC toxin family PIN domain ribonuclease [Chloroflexota bacterium]
MILVDTSVWVSHLRTGDVQLGKLLNDGEVLCHPFVIGELACGNLSNRREVLSLLHLLPMASTANNEEILQFVEAEGLSGVGVGLTDVHLLASALLSGAPLWTLDRPLRAASVKLGIAYTQA